MATPTPLTKSQFEAITDALGVQYVDYLSLPIAAEVTDLNASATSNIGRIVAVTDKRTVAKLLQPFLDLKDQAANPAKAAAAIFQGAVQAIQTNVGNLDTYCAANGARVSREFADLAKACGVTVAGLSVYNAQDVTLATLTVTAPGVLTFGNAGAIDPNRYGAAACFVELADTMATGGTLHLTMKKADNSTVVVDVVLPDGASATDDPLAIGTGGAKYVDCTAATITGGSAATVNVVAASLRTPAP